MVRTIPSALLPPEKPQGGGLLTTTIDDIVKYVGPSLERHRGCDLIDLNPGAGVWSRTLHTLLEPRSHIMMEADAALYRPILADMLSKDNVTMIHESGIQWRHLVDMLHARFPDVEDAEARLLPPQRNNTILVTANLTMHPKKPFGGFDSITSLLIYQIMCSIRTRALFQRYGLVRMLVWINDEDKERVLPRSINRRKRSALEAELSCEWVHEVAGVDAEFKKRTALRDEWIDLESGYQTVARMEAAGLKVPSGRATRTFTQVVGKPELAGVKLAGVHPPMFQRPYLQEKDKLEALEASKLDQGDLHRLNVLRQRHKYMEQGHHLYLELLCEQERILKLVDSPSEFQTAITAWEQRLRGLKKNPRNEFSLIRDSYHLFRQDPPVLLWDRRQYEPLSTRPGDFFPNAAVALLDIQPKTMHPLLREHGPESSRSGDMADLIFRYMLSNGARRVSAATAAVWGGFDCPASDYSSLTDPRRGGSPIPGSGELNVRALNQEQWLEIVQAWMDWPFRPTYRQMLGRLMDEGDDGGDDEDDDSQPAGMGLYL